MKLYLTNRLFTHGIEEVQGKLIDKFPNMASHQRSGYDQSVFKPYWHLTKDDALEHARLMIENKYKSIEIQKDKIFKLEVKLFKMRLKNADK